MQKAIENDARQGLRADPRWIPSKWFYDERGSMLFDEITKLPEYYLTRAETAILLERATEIVELTQADTVVELGSGTSEKSSIILDAFDAAGKLKRFEPLDVDEVTLRSAAESIIGRYQNVEVVAVVGDFEHNLSDLPTESTRMIAFIGSTIGNLDPTQRKSFLQQLVSTMNPGDSFLLGTDLVKSPERLHAAYNDSEGITAEFNRNILRVLNARLDADFDPDSFAHVAFYDPDQEWIEMRLRSMRGQTVTLDRIDMQIEIKDGEEIRTEISAKFRKEVVEEELASAGLEMRRWWTDRDDAFALSLSFKT